MDRLQLRLTGRAGSQDDCDYFQFQIHNKEISREGSRQSEAIIESIHEETEETIISILKQEISKYNTISFHL